MLSLHSKPALILLIVFFAIWIRWQKNIFQNDYDGFNFEITITNHSETKEMINKFVNAPCKHPVVLRNAFNLTEIGCDKHDQHDSALCMNIVHTRFVKVIGKRIKTVTVLKKTKEFSRNSTISVNLSELFTDEKYSEAWMGPTWMGPYMAVRTSLSENEEMVQNNLKSIVHVNDTTSDGYVYVGGQHFLARGKNTGLTLHAALGKNVHILLSGQKRWLMISPDYWSKFGCELDKSGLAARCNMKTNIYSSYNISIDSRVYAYMNENNIKITDKHKLIDTTLNPGDVLINCDYWLHSVENLAASTYALSLRYYAKPKGLFKEMLFYSTHQWNIFTKSLYRSFKTKVFDIKATTYIDQILFTAFTWGPYNVIDKTEKGKDEDMFVNLENSPGCLSC